jgi:Fe-S-cluster containining protein
MGKASNRKNERRNDVQTQEQMDAQLLAWAQKVTVQTRDITANAWSLSHTPEQLSKIQERLDSDIDRNVDNIYKHLDQLRQAGDPTAKVDCKIGCNYCCHLEVTVSAPEVIHVAEYVRKNQTQEEQDALLGRIRDRMQVTKDMSDDERAASHLPCPLLVGGLCSVHPARPVMCRTFHSSDVDACRRANEGEDVAIPVARDFSIASAPVYSGELAAFDQARNKIEPLWFTEALELALTTGASREWCRSANPFAPASKARYEALQEKRST